MTLHSLLSLVLCKAVLSWLLWHGPIVLSCDLHCIELCKAVLGCARLCSWAVLPGASVYQAVLPEAVVMEAVSSADDGFHGDVLVLCTA